MNLVTVLKFRNNLSDKIPTLFEKSAIVREFRNRSKIPKVSENSEIVTNLEKKKEFKIIRKFRNSSRISKYFGNFKKFRQFKIVQKFRNTSRIPEKFESSRMSENSEKTL